MPSTEEMLSTAPQVHARRWPEGDPIGMNVSIFMFIYIIYPMKFPILTKIKLRFLGIA